MYQPFMGPIGMYSGILGIGTKGERKRNDKKFRLNRYIELDSSGSGQ